MPRWCDALQLHISGRPPVRQMIFGVCLREGCELFYNSQMLQSAEMMQAILGMSDTGISAAGDPINTRHILGSVEIHLECMTAAAR